MTKDEIIAMALRSGASVGKWGDAVLSADSLQLFAKEIERQAYERAAEVCESVKDQSRHHMFRSSAEICGFEIRAMIEGDGK